jgi:hypothetical protein
VRAANQEVAVNYRPAAIKAAAIVALTLLPGVVFAGGSSGQCTCVDFNNSTEVVTGITSSWVMEHLRHVGNSTLHKFVIDPNSIPPGVCRAIAIKWNIGVFLNRGDKFFTRLLRRSAQHNCRIEFDKAPSPNADGSFDLDSVRPSK